MRRIVLLIVVCLVVAVLWMRRTDRNEGAYHYEKVTVQRGNLVHVIRESGDLFPREPVLVKNRFPGKLKWVVEDASWVENGDTVFIIDAGEKAREVAELRSKLIAKRQEMRLAELTSEHTRKTEELKLDAAERALELEKIRYRILTSAPVGGRELIRLHEELLPLEQEARELRLAYEDANDTFLAAEDAFLVAQDNYESARNNMLRAQSEIDELETDVARDPDELQPEEKDELARQIERMDKARTTLADARERLPGLREKMEEQRESTATLEAPLRELEQKLAAADDQSRELYVRLEIEKRGLPLTQLQLDERAAEMTLEGAREEHADGRKAFEQGAISEAALNVLKVAEETAENELAIVRQKIKIESRPPAPEVLEEARMKLRKAEATAQGAREAYEKAMDIADANIAVQRAAVRSMEFEIDQAGNYFSEIIEDSIAMAKRELEFLDVDDDARREKLREDLARMEARVEELKANPPNVYKAPVTGIATLKIMDGAPTKIGDMWYEDDAVVKIYPPGNMEVAARVNEVNQKLVEAGMPTDVIVPSLGDRRFQGEVYQVAAIGKDKYERRHFDFRERPPYAGVTQFEVRIRLLDGDADMRAGMSVVAELAVGRTNGVAWLPAGAVHERAGKLHVLTGRPGSLDEHAVEGESFGDDYFVITSGLEPGAEAWIEKHKNL